ncbi:TRAP transporter small permease [Loktanella sp. S4079]|uniref:TRAP transporter small permease n=1 Tax=Loktanella sp. S4079 TaxID=579483 RepID=UPI00069750BD|nr:TRAP transporter small permease [Loktanella sp. S4079]
MRIWLDRLARVLAALGGLAILATALAVTLSVLGRNIGIGGLRGDFELVEFSCVLAAGLFLPLCQVSRGHVMVDLFTNWLPSAVRRVIDRLWLALFAAGWGALTVLTLEGMQDSMAYGDRSMMLSLPLWWTFVPSILGGGAACLIASAQVVWPGAMSTTEAGA